MGPDTIVPVVAVISLFLGLPGILVGAALGKRFFKIKERELELRQQELDVERERITVLRLLEENDHHDRIGEINRSSRN